MKVHILYPFKNGPWGGANQFLKAIKGYLEKKSYYEYNPKKANIILFNGNPSAIYLINELYKLKKYNSKLLIFIRIAGPIFLARNKNLEIDKIFYDLNNAIIDGVIFQSEWSKQKNFLQGMSKNTFESVIINAPDTSIFNTINKKPFNFYQKVRVIATSWSGNLKKGFSTYQWLDENIDFSRYEVIFIGNSPVKFKNINHIPPLDSEKLAAELKASDIFITASEYEACSNSLIEALHCGLPAVAFKNGSDPELVGRGGEFFSTAEEIPDLLDQIVMNYSNYQNNIPTTSLELVGEAYSKFIENVFIRVQRGEYIPKQFYWFDYFKIRKALLWWRVKQRLISLKYFF